jgi:peptidoglycan/xylan/chitin deacetylase (PgdA/CDA1 family)
MGLFAIRDDDVSYFTPAESLETVYQPAFRRGVPVSFAVVPFQSPTGNAWSPRGDGAEAFPLGDNPELVRWLKQKVELGLAQILLHGCYHRYPNGVPEFATPDDHAEKLEKGRRHLEQVFGQTPRVFVPPSNALSASGLRAVKQGGLHLLGSWSLSPRLRGWNGAVIAPWMKRQTFQWRHHTYFYPFPLFMNGLGEMACCALTPSSDENENVRLLSLTAALNGRFCLATHAWEIKADLARQLDGLIGRAGSLGMKFVDAERLFLRS